MVSDFYVFKNSDDCVIWLAVVANAEDIAWLDGSITLIFPCIF